MVGVVIINFNTADDVKSCVKSIKEKTSTEYKLYIVDNCSIDNSAEILKNEYGADDSVVLLFSNENNGFSAGNNIGIKQAIKDGCDILCVTNPDIILINDAITVLENKIKNDPTVGVATPSILDPLTHKESQFARAKLTFSNFLAEKSFLKHFKCYCKKHSRYIIENQKFSKDFKFFGMTYGCFYLATAQYFISSNFLDEDVFLFNEEDIMAYKLEEQSLYTLISPDAVVLHNHHSSIKKTSVANRVFHFRRSELLVLRKYGKVSKFKLLPIISVFKLSWFFKSIKSKEYRVLKKKYFKALSEIKKIKV